MKNGFLAHNIVLWILETIQQPKNATRIDLLDDIIEKSRFLAYRDMASRDVFSFSQFTRKRKVLELSVGISANINLHIAVILSPNSSLYDLQRPRYRYAK